MARPAIEWPIPTYVAELRDRLILTYRVPPRALAELRPPLEPELVEGKAMISLCLGNGRCLKTVGGAPVLASEFHISELVTPARWVGACRAARRGTFLLRFLSDSAGLRRLVRTALRCAAEPCGQSQAVSSGAYRCCVNARFGNTGAAVSLRRPVREDPWPADSVFPTQPAAEAALLHPEWSFVPDENGGLVRAVPVRHYARSTTHVLPFQVGSVLVAGLLDVPARDLVLDHVMFQKRCTHTWLFPPERIPVAAGSTVAVPQFGSLPRSDSAAAAQRGPRQPRSMDLPGGSLDLSASSLQERTPTLVESL